MCLYLFLENDTSSLLPKKTFLDLNDDDTDALIAQMKQKRAMRKPIFEESGKIFKYENDVLTAGVLYKHPFLR